MLLNTYYFFRVVVLGYNIFLLKELFNISLDGKIILSVSKFSRKAYIGWSILKFNY